MQIKVHDGTVRFHSSSLCTSCAHATITVGESSDQRLVECGAVLMRSRRIPFRVTSCTEYADRSQPSFGELVRLAWILRPHATRKRPAGFVRGQDLTPKEMCELLRDGPDV